MCPVGSEHAGLWETPFAPDLPALPVPSWASTLVAHSLVGGSPWMSHLISNWLSLLNQSAMIYVLGFWKQAVLKSNSGFLPFKSCVTQGKLLHSSEF